jgi:cholinesterase
MVRYLASFIVTATVVAAQVPTIETTIGSVKGHIASWPERAGVSEYLGIPYAEPPTGQLRFAAPKPFKGRKEVNADRFSDSCLQALDPKVATSSATPVDDAVQGYGENMGGIKDRKYSEDCLTLNIWTKHGSQNASKAVMIWIYGGGESPMIFKTIVSWPGCQSLT